MTPDQIHYLQRSYANLHPIIDSVGRSFYRKLFELSPDSRHLLSDDRGQRWQTFLNVFEKMLRSKVRSMLTLPVTESGSRELSIPGISDLAKGYVNQGFREEHFAYGRQALLWSLQEHLGPAYDDMTEDAWGHAYDIITGSMMSVINADAVEPELPQAAQGRSAPASEGETLRLLFNQ